MGMKEDNDGREMLAMLQLCTLVAWYPAYKQPISNCKGPQTCTWSDTENSTEIPEPRYAQHMCPALTPTADFVYNSKRRLQPIANGNGNE
ncbi:hypothetical protein ACLKA7_013120 [Drosophila subpalustris]